MKENKILKDFERYYSYAERLIKKARNESPEVATQMLETAAQIKMYLADTLSKMYQNSANDKYFLAAEAGDICLELCRDALKNKNTFQSSVYYSCRRNAEFYLTKMMHDKTSKKKWKEFINEEMTAKKRYNIADLIVE
ncbi:MAG: hypothetical protein QXK37_03705 [Candidatus Woesearchaeota archaeon]